MILEASKMYYVMCVSAASLHRESTDSLLYKWCLVQSLVCMILQCILGNIISIICCTCTVTQQIVILRYTHN